MRWNRWTRSDRVARRARVDAELVRRGLARSREQAAELIGAGRVSIDGMPSRSSRRRRSPRAPPEGDRAGRALLGVARRAQADRRARCRTFGLSVDDRRCLDAGASTGGFTEVLLDRGAREVVAVDVGYGQLVWRLRNDRGSPSWTAPTSAPHGRADRRTRRSRRRGPVVHLAERRSCPRSSAARRRGADMVPMVKPQFEVGKDRVGAGGVVSRSAPAR